MSEPVFIRGLTLDEIAGLCGVSPGRRRRTPTAIVNIAPLDRAAPFDLSFFDNRNYVATAAATHAGACMTTAALTKFLPPHVAVFCSDPIASS